MYFILGDMSFSNKLKETQNLVIKILKQFVLSPITINYIEKCILGTDMIN